MQELEASPINGQTAQEWCAEGGVKLSRLQYWRIVLGDGKGDGPRSAGYFEPRSVREAFAQKRKDFQVRHGQ